MGNSFRLRANTMFNRIDEEQKEEPLKIVFLSVEGNKTEKQYFQYVEKYREKLGIKREVHIHTLQRARNDNLSAPENVLELLEEYLDIRNDCNLPERLKAVIPEEYSVEFIESYLKGEHKRKDKKTKEFEAVLQEAGIDFTYQYFLKEYKGKENDDVFGIVIDRDYHSHGVKQMKDIVSQCRSKNYNCYITTPLFEFWLLMHLVDIKEIYAGELDRFIVNENLTDKHTFTSKEVSKIAKHSKAIGEQKFLEYYLPKIDFAIRQAKENFTMDLDELIGEDSSVDSKMGKLGTNIPQLFELLREA